MRTLLAAAAFAIAGVAAAQAADIAAMTGHMTKLGADSSALVYYTAAPDGFHLAVTTQHGLTDQAAGRVTRIYDDCDGGFRLIYRRVGCGFS